MSPQHCHMYCTYNHIKKPLQLLRHSCLWGAHTAHTLPCPSTPPASLNCQSRITISPIRPDALTRRSAASRAQSAPFNTLRVARRSHVGTLVTFALLSLMRSHMSMTSRVVYASGPASVRVRFSHLSLRRAASVKRAMSCGRKVDAAKHGAAQQLPQVSQGVLNAQRTCTACCWQRQQPLIEKLRAKAKRAAAAISSTSCCTQAVSRSQSRQQRAALSATCPPVCPCKPSVSHHLCPTLTCLPKLARHSYQ